MANPKARTASSTQRGVIFSITDTLPPNFGVSLGDSSPLYDLSWKSGLQGFTYFKESVIDVTGLTTSQDETLFFTGGDIQQPFPIQANNGVGYSYPGDKDIYEYFFITDRRMTKVEFQESIGTGSLGNASGVSFADSEVDQQSLIFGFARGYHANGITGQTSNSLDLVESWNSNFGIARTSASNKLYCYHCVWSYTDGTAAQIIIPDTRFVVSFVVDKEKDLVYLQRLKRSYELQNELV